MEIEIIKLTKKELSLSLTGIKKKTAKILRLLNIEDYSLNIVLVNDPYIRKLNRRFLKRDYPTDVLAFGEPQLLKEKSDIFLGEVIISIDTIKRSAKIYNHPLEKEFYYCLIHGILHLLGCDDRTVKGNKEMIKKQEEILNKILEDEKH